MDKNAILAAVLSIGVLVAWDYFYIRPIQKKNAAKSQARAEKEKAAKAKMRAVNPLVRAAPASPQPAMPAQKKPETKAVREVRVRVDVGPAIYEFTNRGAAMVSARLKKYLTDDLKRPIDLISELSPAMMPLYFKGGDTAELLNGASFQVEGGDITLTPSRPEGRLRFFYRDKSGLFAEKILTFRYDRYVIGMALRVDQPRSPKPIGIAWGPSVGGAAGNVYGGIVEGPMSFIDKSLEYDTPELDKPTVHASGTRWTALQTKYFVAALIPRDGNGRSEIRRLGGKDNKIDYAVIGFMPEGARSAAGFDVYVGPKETGRLAKLNASLEEALDYGIFSFIAKPLMAVLRISNAVLGNWGLAIILLTVLIKLVFYPLTQYGMRNMRNMQKLQPKMTQLKEIYKDDKNRMNQEVMALYKENNVNPMMGCLPMIVQIPVFFGLYNALLVSIELRHAPFFWIADLSAREPRLFPILTLLMGASMFVQQKMTPSVADPAQAKMMMFMPVMFTGMFLYWPVPVGLVIYWLMNNILSVIQQYFVNKSVTPPKLAEEN